VEPLKIHFLNVGHGDCTIVQFPSGRIAMIDINDSGLLDEDTEDELGRKMDTLGPSIYRVLGLDLPELLKKKLQEYITTKIEDPVRYFTANFGTSIFRYIQSHPDMDHMSGLARLIRSGVSIANFWDTAHSVQKEPQWKEGKYDERDWQAYQQLRNSDKARKYTLGNSLDYFNEDGISILYPTGGTSNATDPNDVSYVLLITYGECCILLAGDAPAKVWENIHEEISAGGRGYRRVHLFKAPHHGRKSGYYWPFVKSLKPDMTVVSVGDLAAEHDAADSYEKYSSVGCYTTREYGTIIATCWPDGPGVFE
jgi:competence protein ComEC